MDIVTIPFEEPLILCVGGEKIQIIAFKTQEHGNIKFGVQAPRSIDVHREEIFLAIKRKQAEALLATNTTTNNIKQFILVEQ